jgi:transposase
LYRKRSDGAKAKKDTIDANKSARLLRGGNLPLASVSPQGLCETRDLLRRRTYLVRQRSARCTHLQILHGQSNLPPFPKKLSFTAPRAERNLPQRFTDPSVPQSARADLAVSDARDEQIAALEWYRTRTAKVEDVQT